MKEIVENGFLSKEKPCDFPVVNKQQINVSLFFVAQLLYNSLSLFGSQSVMLWGNLVFSAPIEDRLLKFSVKIPKIYANLVYTLF